MKWADAMNASTVKAAYREGEWDEPNIVLDDKGKIKAFRAGDAYAWERTPLREAKKYGDWKPAVSRDHPFNKSKKNT